MPRDTRTQPFKAGANDFRSQARVPTIVLLYAAFASLWVLLSNKTMELLFSMPSRLAFELAGQLGGLSTSFLRVGAGPLFLKGEGKDCCLNIQS